MSASMWKAMLEEAGTFLKEEKYQQALDASRRVSQFDANNFQAFMCVGLASFHLQQWEDSENAFVRATALKPDLPAPWKNLVDLYDAQGELKKKVGPLEKLIDIFQKGKKTKACQKWIADLASTAFALNLWPKAFDAWFLLVNDNNSEFPELSLNNTPNDEIQHPLLIWLELIDLLQRPHLSLSDCNSMCSLDDVSAAFFAVAATWSWDLEGPKSRVVERTESAIAFFMRHHLDMLKKTKPNSQDKKTRLSLLDSLATSIVQWRPDSKLPCEYLLLRAEDSDSPLDSTEILQLVQSVSTTHKRSPLTLLFQAVELWKSKLAADARAALSDALASSSSSSFTEFSLCVQPHMELAEIALEDPQTRDVDSCLKRLEKSRAVANEKATLLGVAPPKPTIFSECRASLMEARARELTGELEKPLGLYRAVLNAKEPMWSLDAALGAAELLRKQRCYEDAVSLLDSHTSLWINNDEHVALAASARGWVLFEQGKAAEARVDLERGVTGTRDIAKKALALKRLGIFYWEAGGAERSDKALCFGHLLQAAKLSPGDADIFAYLGKWYQEVAKDVVRAEKCYLKALSLSPVNELAGVALSEVYEAQGKSDLNVKMWEQVTAAPESAPVWALLRLAQALVDQDNERAVSKLHLVLRNDPTSPRNWCILGHVYRHFGKIVASQRSYAKAIELGEQSWCVVSELARIEASLHMYDEALARIRHVLEMDLDATSKTVVTMLLADVLFKHAKSLCAEGSYGHAAANLKEASQLLRGCTTSFAATPEAFKLLGDVHALAFYLTPEDFTDDSSNSKVHPWVSFLSGGRKAHEAVVTLMKSSNVSGAALAQAYYDAGMSCWYEALALATTSQVPVSAFTHSPSAKQASHTAPIHQLQEKTMTYMQLALRNDASNSFAWNGIAIAHRHAVVKQFAWSRSIHHGQCDAAWANLGMFYTTHAPRVPKRGPAIARSAFLHLQGVNPNNPAMWTGYGMLAAQVGSTEQLEKSAEAFGCALQATRDLDALKHFVATWLALENKKLDSVAASAKTSLSLQESAQNESLLFGMRKYLERDPFHPAAWNLLGVVQQRIGLHDMAVASFSRALDLAKQVPCGQNKRRLRSQMRGTEWNLHVARLSVQSAIGKRDQDNFHELKELQATFALPDDSLLARMLKLRLLFLNGSSTDAATAASTLLNNVSKQSKKNALCLALIALTVRYGSDGMGDVIERCKAQFAQRHNEEDALLLDLLDRQRSNKSEVLDRLNARARSDAGTTYDWIRLCLALLESGNSVAPSIDECWKRITSAAARSRSTGCSEELPQVASLVSMAVGMSTDDLSKAQRLVRMDPTNALSYAIAGARFLKRATVAETSDDDKSRWVSAAELLLRQGLKVSALSPFDLALLHGLLGAAATLLNQKADAQHHADQGIAQLESTSGAEAATSLLRARVMAVADVTNALTEYKRAAKMDPTAVMTILVELGALFEGAEDFDGAIQAWKLVVASASPNTEDSSQDNASTVRNVFGNLRLALVHGSKQNGKSAKKHGKATVAAATEGGVHSSIVHVAAFVEDVLSKC
ncbi:TPA: hypothetical protein N0F65_000564 [Lagenidium giganteum]|uniref:Uncharacterized protein n=1 Tax=Lagenidium giganteum TaxID=4803 RepID=A0AAV2Z484_9STRA|nr:TPA: hypothetical protein N0F65_000564 [Lagenidium giganteum]